MLNLKNCWNRNSSSLSTGESFVANPVSRRVKLVIAGLVMLVVGSLSLNATLSPGVAQASFSTGWSSYAPYRQYSCTSIPQSGFVYQIWLTPTSGKDVDLYLKSGTQILKSGTLSGTATEYIYFTPNQSYANGLQVCGYGWDWPGGYYTVSVQES